jgi:hypothetical protein
MLMHHADAGGECRARIARRQDLSSDRHAPGIGDVVTEDDVHQRGLAGPVLAQQGEDFAAGDGEGDRVVCHQIAEALGDAIDLERRS